MDFTIFGCALQFLMGSRGRGLGMRALTAAALMAVATMMLPAAIRAQQSDDRSRCFAREGVSPEQKLANCTAVIESGGQTPQVLVGAFNSRGNAHLNNRNYDRAIADYNETIRLDPKYAMAFVNRAFAYQEKAQWDFDAYLAEGVYENRAIRDLDEAIGLDPNSAVAFRNRGLVNSRLQRYDRAIQDLDKAIRLDPNVAASFSGRAYALRFVGQYERAIADYRKALTLSLEDAGRRQIETILKQLGAAGQRDTAPT